MEISYWTLWMNLHCSLQRPLILPLPTQDLTCWFHFCWFIYIDKKNVKQWRGKGERQKLGTFKHKRNHTIACYPKSLLILTTYQVKMWQIMIISPVRPQPYDINVKEILLKSLCHTHQNIPRCTHLFYNYLRSLLMDFVLIPSLPQQ